MQLLQKAADVAVYNCVCVFYIKNTAGHLTGSGTSPVYNPHRTHSVCVFMCVCTSVDILPSPFLAHYQLRQQREPQAADLPQLKTAVLSPVCALCASPHCWGPG